MKPPLILPMDSRLMPRSRARVDVAQTHRFPEFMQAHRQPFVDALGVVVVRRGGPGVRVRMAGTWVAYNLVVASHALICRKKCELFQFDHPTLL